MSFAASRAGPSTVPASDGSRTITVLDSQPREEGEGGSHDPSSAEVGRLALRGGRNRPRVVWSEDTVDNEGAGKKSSKICCVYHKPKQFDESSSDESTDSDSSYDGPNNHSHGVRRRKRHHHHHHDADSAEDGGDATRNSESGESVVHELSSEEDVNRYERGSGKAKKGKGVARK